MCLPRMAVRGWSRRVWISRKHRRSIVLWWSSCRHVWTARAAPPVSRSTCAARLCASGRAVLRLLHLHGWLCPLAQCGSCWLRVSSELRQLMLLWCVACTAFPSHGATARCLQRMRPMCCCCRSTRCAPIAWAAMATRGVHRRTSTVWWPREPCLSGRTAVRLGRCLRMRRSSPACCQPSIARVW